MDATAVAQNAPTAKCDHRRVEAMVRVLPLLGEPDATRRQAGPGRGKGVVDGRSPHKPIDMSVLREPPVFVLGSTQYENPSAYGGAKASMGPGIRT